MVIIGLAIALLVGLILYIRRFRKVTGYSRDNACAAVVFLAIGLVALLIAIPLNYADNSVRIAELKAFSEANIQNYATTVTETQAILSEEEFTDKLVSGSLEKTEIGQSISQRIMEWRDAVNAYNIEVAHKQRIRTIWIYPGWIFIPPEVNELPLLTIEE